MRILKTVLLVLLFCVLGAALGGGSFYVQQHFSKKTSNSVSAAPGATATPQPTPKPNLFFDESSKVAFSLEQKLVLQPLELSGFGSVIPTSFTVQQMKDVVTVVPTDTTVYIVNTDTVTAAFTAAKSRVQRLVLTSYPSQSAIVKTNAGESLTHKLYTSSGGDSLESYELEKDGLYVLFFRDPSATTNPLTDVQFESLVKSLTIGGTATPSPSSSATASATSSLLLQQ